MSALLCVGRDPEWWTPGSPSARLAIAICGHCTGCPDNDPNPRGVIRQGVAYADTGAALALCACGYPQDDRRATPQTLCRRCAPPRLDRWRTDVTRWAARGDGHTEMGRRIGFDRTSVRDALARWAREDLDPAPVGASAEGVAA
jgi:hypothetical protein